MSVGSLGAAHSAWISNPTPGENDSQSRGGYGLRRGSAPEHHEPALCCRATGRLAPLQLGMIIKTHCDDRGDNSRASGEVTEGSALSVGHGKLGSLAPVL